MKNLLRSSFVIVVAALLSATVNAPSNAASRGASAFDGQWSVIITTTQGDCPRSLRYGLRIAGGQVVSDEGNYQVAGRVAGNGGIRVMVAEGGRSATGSGRLAGDNGAGAWRTTTGECAGQWTASRRNW